MPRNPACTALIFSPRPALRGIPWPAGPRLGAPRGLRQRRGSPRRCDSAPAAGGATGAGRHRERPAAAEQGPAVQKTNIRRPDPRWSMACR